MNTILFDPMNQFYLVLRVVDDTITGIGAVGWSNDYNLKHVRIKAFSTDTSFSQTLENYPHLIQLSYQLPFRRYYPELLI